MTANAVPSVGTPAASEPTPASVGTPARRRSLGRTGQRFFYWMLLPALGLFFVFHTLPALIGIFFSFTNYRGYGSWSFVGLHNYRSLFLDENIWAAYRFTFLFAIVSTVLVNVIAMLLALGLNARIGFRSGFRAIFFTPYVLSVLIVGYVFSYLFSNTLPQVLPSIPVFANNILASEQWAWVPIVIVTVWQSAAFATILYLAGLQTIPGEVYEAAALDGATGWTQFWKITFPLISGFFTINMVLSLKGFLQVFDQVVALTNGGPGTSTQSITMLIFRGGFQGGEYAYQTANAVIYFIVIVLVSLVQFRILNRRQADF